MRHRNHRSTGFTLVEILVVLAIITLLAAVLLPVFRTVQERGYQAHCASNLKQIGVAVQMYRQDEKRYPASLAFLLPATAELNETRVGQTAATFVNSEGTGHLKSTKGTLLCPDDITDSSKPYSSYGDISTSLDPGNTGPFSDEDSGRYVWNYWGYKDDGTAYLTNDAAYIAAFTGDATPSTWRYLVNPKAQYNATTNPVDLNKLPRLANRFAPPSTIITHCVYHRMPTSDIKTPEAIYVPANASKARGARDLILRLDGSAKLLDVTQFKNNKNWQTPNF